MLDCKDANWEKNGPVMLILEWKLSGGSLKLDLFSFLEDEEHKAAWR